MRRPSRWRKSKTWRSPSSPQIYQKYIYTWNCSYRTPTERWQKTSDLPKDKKLPTYLGRAKENRKNRDKRRGTGPAPVGGSCEGAKVSTHQEAPSRAETGVGSGGSFTATEESAATGVRRGKRRDSRSEDRCRPALTSPRLVCSPAGAGGGWELRLGLRSDRRERTGVGGVNTA